MYYKEKDKYTYYIIFIIAFQITLTFLMSYYLKSLDRDMNIEISFILSVSLVLSECFLFTILFGLIKREKISLNTEFSKEFRIFRICFNIQIFEIMYFFLFINYDLEFWSLKIGFFIEFLFFLLAYFIIISYNFLKKDARNVVTNYLLRLEECFPIILGIMIILELKLRGLYPGNFITYLYLLLIFISSIVTFKSLKKRSLNRTNTGFEAILSILIFLMIIIVFFILILFLIILLQIKSNSLQDDTKLFCYAFTLIIAIYIYILLYAFSDLFKFKFFELTKLLIYLILFLSYILMKLEFFHTDILNKAFKIISEDSFTEALVTFVVFDSLFQNGLCLFEDLKSKYYIKKAKKSAKLTFKKLK
uniref:Uncharacterized protein n=2 Tax=Clostridioides difficile TaxID=1496 RepID=A0A386JBW8_CLODI|nr:hypothetical protein pHSJD-312_00002 [Clostridioides difficile]